MNSYEHMAKAEEHLERATYLLEHGELDQVGESEAFVRLAGVHVSAAMARMADLHRFGEG